MTTPSGSTQLFVASTGFGLATIVAALEQGAFPPAAQRILLLSNNAAVPETAHRIEEVAGVAALLSRFDAVHDYNDAIAPQHPSLWSPREVDLPLLARYLRARWSLTDEVRLVLESIQVDPALALCRIFPDARIDVYADGLMSYGPTRTQLPVLVSSRIERLLHLDLVPGLSPVLLTEHAVPARLIAADAFRRVIDALDPPPDAVQRAAPGEVAVLLGQYLAALGVLTPAEEEALHLDMVRGAVAAGYRSLVFKPHPTAPPLLAQPLVAEAARLGAVLTVHDHPALVETWFGSAGVGCVIGCFSTALVTAASCYHLPVARVGTELLLERLRPYQNSNRIPVTIVDATLPHVSRLATGGQRAAGSARHPASEELSLLVGAVSYCMQPERYPTLRPIAQQLLDHRWEELRPYFKRKRLTLLDLPGRWPARSPGGTGASVPRPVRSSVRTVLGPEWSNRLSRTARGLSRRVAAQARSEPPRRSGR